MVSGATRLAAAGVAAAGVGAQREARRWALREAETGLSAWHQKLGSISTALALARDAA